MSLFGPDHRKATVALKNATGATMMFQVLHQYTGDSTQDSGWFQLNNGEERGDALTVNYNTGFGTTGVDNWIINGIEHRDIAGSLAGIDVRWRSGTGALSDWKVHTLRSEDDNAVTTIVIYPTTVEFHSNSGTSSTGWHSEIPRIPDLP